MSEFDLIQSRGRVLVVDDNAANRSLLRQELELAEFEVDEASSGKECVEKVRTGWPEVVLLDVQMPVMDGIQTCRSLKQDPATSLVPVLFLTGRSPEEETAVAALRAGGNDFLQKPYSPHILLARVSSQISIYRAHSRLRELAMTDELTGVFSRRFLFEVIRKELKQLSRPGPSVLSCIMIDVDHFKHINDRYGHSGGDEVLRNVGSILRACTRGNDIVARFGGEEFTVLLPATRVEGALLLAEKIRLAVEVQTRERVAVTISAGVAECESGSKDRTAGDASCEENMNQLIKCADTALYQAKQQGRNRVCRWTA